MNKDDLLKLIEDDDLGLLEVKPKQAATTADDRLTSSFIQINQFVTEHGREPLSGKGIQEHQLYSRLKAIRESSDKVESLSSIDVHGLLKAPSKVISTINDIFEDDDLGILTNEADSIFNLKHVDSKPRAEADYVARRTVCKNFQDYEDLFKKVHLDLREGNRSTQRFTDKGETLREGNFYILSGVLLYLESVDITSPEKTIDGKRFRKDGRTRCIFENGTQSNMLYRSLAKQLLADGRIVSERLDEGSVNEHLYKSMSSITEEDDSTGYIYVLSSISEKEEICSIKNLYKIGYSSTPVEDRIKNAESEPTYLMAPVNIVTIFQCYNMNPQKLELLLHTFFGNSCLNIDIFDKNGQRHTPREWFVAPLDVIEDAINLILNGEIVHCRYDADNQRIVRK